MLHESGESCASSAVSHRRSDQTPGMVWAAERAYVHHADCCKLSAVFREDARRVGLVQQGRDI